VREGEKGKEAEGKRGKKKGKWCKGKRKKWGGKRGK
jgi:hypothetical protein